MKNKKLLFGKEATKAAEWQMCFPTSGEEARPGVNEPDEIRQRNERRRDKDDLSEAKGVRKNKEKN